MYDFSETIRYFSAIARSFINKKPKTKEKNKQNTTHKNTPNKQTKQKQTKPHKKQLASAADSAMVRR